MADNSTEYWWAVLYTPLHTGYKKLEYVQAPDRSTAEATVDGGRVVGGPYNTLAEAQKEYKGTKGPHGTDPIAGKTPSVSAKPIPIPFLSGIDRFAAVSEAAYKTLTDGKLWRSVGWIVLGIVLLIVAIRLWMGKTLMPEASEPPILPVPV